MTSRPFRPNKAATCASVTDAFGEELVPYEPDLASIRLPCYATPKLDGIRSLIREGQAVTLSLKNVPNIHIRNTIAAANLPPLDGELTLSQFPDEAKDFNVIQSAVMSHGGKPDFHYIYFDRTDLSTESYTSRLKELYAIREHWDFPWLHRVPSLLCNTLEQLTTVHESFIKAGYEGTVTRGLHNRYKQGRSTAREGGMTKIKEWDSAEGVILDFKELYENHNPDERDNLGHAKRSHRADGKIPAGTLGAFCTTFRGKPLDIGTGKGLTTELRQEIWDNREAYLGRVIEFKHQGVSAKGVPRFPSYFRFRDEILI